MTFPHIPHQWPPLLFSHSLCTQYITQSLLLPHVVNIITFMSTLNNISLYLNTISPHRATILIKIPSPRRRDFFLLLFPGGNGFRGIHQTAAIVAINAQMASCPSVTMSRSKESSPVPEEARCTLVVPGSPLAGVTVNPGMAPVNRCHSWSHLTSSSHSPPSAGTLITAGVMEPLASFPR